MKSVLDNYATGRDAVAVETDDTLQRGDLRLETDIGVLDARLKSTTRRAWLTPAGHALEMTDRLHGHGIGFPPPSRPLPRRDAGLLEDEPDT